MEWISFALITNSSSKSNDSTFCFFGLYDIIICINDINKLSLKLLHKSNGIFDTNWNYEKNELEFNKEYYEKRFERFPSLIKEESKDDTKVEETKTKKQLKKKTLSK